MPDRASIDAFPAQRHMAVVGVSRDARQFANGVPVVDGACPLTCAGHVRGIHHVPRVSSGHRIAA